MADYIIIFPPLRGETWKNHGHFLHQKWTQIFCLKMQDFSKTKDPPCIFLDLRGGADLGHPRSVVSRGLEVSWEFIQTSIWFLLFPLIDEWHFIFRVLMHIREKTEEVADWVMMHRLQFSPDETPMLMLPPFLLGELNQPPWTSTTQVACHLTLETRLCNFIYRGE